MVFGRVRWGVEGGGSSRGGLHLQPPDPPPLSRWHSLCGHPGSESLGAVRGPANQGAGAGILRPITVPERAFSHQSECSSRHSVHTFPTRRPPGAPPRCSGGSQSPFERFKSSQARPARVWDPGPATQALCFPLKTGGRTGLGGREPVPPTAVHPEPGRGPAPRQAVRTPNHSGAGFQLCRQPDAIHLVTENQQERRSA